FVNDRFIKNGYLHHAVLSAYEGLLKEGIQPSYFIYLQVPPHTLDINIHPTKTEVKFDEEQALYAILRSSVKHSLGQFNVAPVLDFQKDVNLETPYHYKKNETEYQTIEVRSDFNPFQKEQKQESSYTAPTYKKSSASWEGLYTGFKEEKHIPEPV